MAFTDIKNIFLSIIHGVLTQGFYILLMLKLHIANNFIQNNIFSKTLLITIIVLAATILIPMAVLCYCLFKLYKLITILIVKIYLGSKYDKYPSGFDVSFAIGKNKSRQIINYIIAIEDTSEDFYLKLKNQILERLEGKDVPRLLSLSKRYFGYEFYKKDPFDVNDYLKDIHVTSKDCASKEEFKLVFDAIVNTPMTKNNEASWEVLITRQAVLWTNNLKHRIIVFRLYHSVGDAACANKIINALLADIDVKKPPDVKIASPITRPLRKSDDDYDVISNHLKHRRDGGVTSKNVLYNPEFQFKYHASWFVEESKEYVEKLKKIKNRKKNLTFNNVLLTAISLSLSKFCQKRTKSVPDTMPLVYAINTKPEDLGAYEDVDLESIDYKNNLTWAQLRFPIISDSSKDFTKNADVIHMLNRIEAEVNLFKASSDQKMQKWFSEKMLDLLPVRLIECMMRWENPAFNLSNLPGSKAFTILGNKVKDVIFFTPDMITFSIGFSCSTYNGRLQLGAMSDEATFSSGEGQEILNGVVEAIDLLDKATQNL